MRRGFGGLLAATVIGGLVAYFITWLVPRSTGFADYTPFAVFWGFLFLSVAALSGVQQELTRASRPVAAGETSHLRVALTFGARVAVGVFVLFAATSPLWSTAVFGENTTLVWPLATGAATYVLVAVTGGVLYGLRLWRGLFWLITVEALARVITVSLALALSGDVLVLAWAVAIPFPTAVICLLIYVRRNVVGKAVLDVSARGLTWNVARTVVASASMGALISGLPLLISLTSSTVPSAVLGLVIITMTLTRAPLTVVLMAFQSYLIVLFQSAGAKASMLLLRLCLAILGVGALLTVLGYALGPPVFAFLFPGESVPSASLIAAMVGSSAVLGLLCATSPALLARSNHAGHSLGWLAAALGTVTCLLIPGEFESRVVIALFVGPAIGLVLHAILLLRGTTRSPANDS